MQESVQDLADAFRYATVNPFDHVIQGGESQRTSLRNTLSYDVESDYGRNQDRTQEVTVDEKSDQNENPLQMVSADGIVEIAQS